MPTALPVIRGSSTALYPFTHTFMALTGKSDSQSANPVRWVRGFPLVRFDFPYDPIKQADKNSLRSAFASAKGQFTGGSGSAALTATADITYSDLSFDSDEFAATERITTQYGTRWSLTQTLPQNFSPGASGGAYPGLSTSAISLLPYTQKRRYQTIVSKVDAGPKYTYAEFGGGLSGFPGANGLMAWEFEENGLIDTEVTAKVNHWLANWGDCFPFSFTDEDTTNYSNVYYGSPELAITHTGPNQSSIRTSLVQMN